jgi:ubiquinol oxidase
MYGAYHTFNFVTGYKQENPSVQSIEWRLIILESIAGVPGFVAAGFRHFRSLRTLDRDHGWIATLLEEAENERMHLLVCLKMFETSFVTRSLVVTAQLLMTPILMGIYIVHPRSMHRFVGYLEETACHTYASIIRHTETPGTKLHADWHNIPAPAIARGYWKLNDDAKWVDALKCMVCTSLYESTD